MRERVPIAVVPAAGLGTRLAPATRFFPKELMPVGPYPMIQWALEEIRDSGIPRAAVVVSPSKPLLTEFLCWWRRHHSLEVTTVEQPRPAGLADALLRVRDLAGASPFALLLPDNVFFPSPGSKCALLQVLRAFNETSGDTCGLIRVRPEHASRYSHAGLVDLSRSAPGLHRLTKLHAKRTGPLQVPEGRSAYKTFARAVLRPHFFEYLRLTARNRAGADEVPALQEVLRRHGLFGTLLEGRGFDAGNPEGYAAAVEFWSRHAARGPQPTK